MNKQATRVLGLGVVFAGAVVFLDLFLTHIPTFDWDALGLVFFLAAVSILSLVAREIPRRQRKTESIGKKGDEFLYLADVIDAALSGRNRTALRTLTEQLKSLALGTIASRARLSKKELLELADKKPESLRAIVQDDVLMKLLSDNPNLGEGLSEQELEKILNKVESWSP